MSHSTLPRIECESTAGLFKVRAPYHPDFAAFAKTKRAPYSGTTWTFSAVYEAAACEALREIYGHDGSYEVVTVACRIHLDFIPDPSVPFFLLGRLIANRRFNDAAVRLGEGVVIIQGEFSRSAGSKSAPMLGPKPATILEVRDVPLSVAQSLAFQFPGSVTFNDPTLPALKRTTKPWQ